MKNQVMTYICDHCQEEIPYGGSLEHLPEYCVHCTTMHFFENKPEKLLLCKSPRCRWSIQTARKNANEQKSKRKATLENKKRKIEESASKCFYCDATDKDFHPWGPKNNPYSLCVECWENERDTWMFDCLAKDAKENFPKMAQKLIDALRSYEL